MIWWPYTMLSFSVDFAFHLSFALSLSRRLSLNILQSRSKHMIDHVDCLVWETTTAQHHHHHHEHQHHEHHHHEQPPLPTDTPKTHPPCPFADLLIHVSSEAGPLRGIQGGYGRGYCTPFGACHGACRSGRPNPTGLSGSRLLLLLLLLLRKLRWKRWLRRRHSRLLRKRPVQLAGAEKLLDPSAPVRRLFDSPPPPLPPREAPATAAAANAAAAAAKPSAAAVETATATKDAAASPPLLAVVDHRGGTGFVVELGQTTPDGSVALPVVRG